MTRQKARTAMLAWCAVRHSGIELMPTQSTCIVIIVIIIIIIIVIFITPSMENILSSATLS